jgi:nitrate reductase beta subunit
MSPASLPEHKTWFFYLQRLCNHCSYPACLAACPRGAIYKRPEDGIVLIDQERCRGYRKCVAACPYKKSLYRPTTRVSEKCVGCYPRIEGKDPLYPGQPLETRCMAACPGKIRIQGLVKMNPDGTWAEDPSNPIYYLVKVAKVALPLYPQFGTEPNGYYIPPRWAPRAYLRQMFGPTVDEAIEKYSAPSRELQAVLQLFRATQQIIFRYEVIEGPKVFENSVGGRKLEIYDDTVVGYGKDGQEVCRVSVEEGVQVRPQKHQNSI